MKMNNVYYGVAGAILESLQPMFKLIDGNDFGYKAGFDRPSKTDGFINFYISSAISGFNFQLYGQKGRPSNNSAKARMDYSNSKLDECEAHMDKYPGDTPENLAYWVDAHERNVKQYETLLGEFSELNRLFEDVTGEKWQPREASTSSYQPKAEKHADALAKFRSLRGKPAVEQPKKSTLAEQAAAKIQKPGLKPQPKAEDPNDRIDDVPAFLTAEEAEKEQARIDKAKQAEAKPAVQPEKPVDVKTVERPAKPSVPSVPAQKPSETPKIVPTPEQTKKIAQVVAEQNAKVGLAASSEFKKHVENDQMKEAQQLAAKASEVVERDFAGELRHIDNCLTDKLITLKEHAARRLAVLEAQEEYEANKPVVIPEPEVKKRDFEAEIADINKRFKEGLMSKKEQLSAMALVMADAAAEEPEPEVDVQVAQQLPEACSTISPPPAAGPVVVQHKANQTHLSRKERKRLAREATGTTKPDNTPAHIADKLKDNVVALQTATNPKATEKLQSFKDLQNSTAAQAIMDKAEAKATIDGNPRKGWWAGNNPAKGTVTKYGDSAKG